MKRIDAEKNQIVSEERFVSTDIGIIISYFQRRKKGSHSFSLYILIPPLVLQNQRTLGTSTRISYKEGFCLVGSLILLSLEAV